MRQKIVLLFFSLLFSIMCYSQSRNISGVITDASTGESLAGAAILVTGTQTGTVTNAEGKFTLSVSSSAQTITVRFIGYKSQIVDIAENMKIAIEPESSTLDEVVVVGYGTVKKRDLTGSIASIKSEDIMKANPKNIQDAMQGRIAGVNITKGDGAPGTGININIRGTNSPYGGSQPLFVIDGIPMSTSNSQETVSLGSDNYYSRDAFSFVDPNNIESIEILKDASSTAIYGSRGSNGVIIITTKTGQTQQDKIDISYSLGVSTVSKKLHMLSSREYAEYENLANINTILLNNGSVYPGATRWDGSTNAVTGVYSPYPWEFPDDDNTYWQDQLFRTALTHDLSISASGAHKGMDYFISGSMLDQDGVVKNSDYKRYSLKINLNKEIRKWLKIGTSTSFSKTLSHMIKTSTNSNNNGNEGVIRSALYFPPVYKIGETLLEDSEYSMVTHPLLYAEALNELKGYTFYTNNYANVNLLKGLIFRTSLSYSMSLNYGNQYFGKDLWEGRDPINGLSMAGDNSWQSLVFDNLLMYNRDFGKHNISATLGTSWEESQAYNKSISVYGFGTDLTNGWLLQEAGNFRSTNSSKYQSQLFSIIARVGYNYANKYYLTLTGRSDASSKFAKGNRSSFFPSFGVSWRASEEEFMHPISNIFTNIKLRYSYGSSGNQGIGSYATFALMPSANYPFGSKNTNGFAPDKYNPGNKDLKWEVTWMHDAGLDLTLFNRVNVTFDLYRKLTNDILQNQQKAASTGVSQILTNIGSVENKGLELSIDGDIIRNDNFKFNLGGNISFNRNKIKELGFGRQFPNTLWNAIHPFVLETGHAIGEIYGYVEDGIWGSRDEVINSKQFQAIYSGYTTSSNDAATETIIRQKWIGEIRYKNLDDTEGDNTINDKDQTYIGNVNPKFTYGFHASFEYKNFDLNFNFQGVYGNDILNMSLLRFYESGGPRNVPVDILKEAWSVDNPSGTAPKIYTTYSRTMRFSSRYLEDGSYLKLRNVTLGYTWRNPFKGLSNLRMYVSGNNLFTITKYSGYDPEVDSFGSSATFRGVDAGGYPQSRSVIFGVNITF